MISVRELFPFQKVAYKSKIIIYGMGKIGKSYLQQIRATNYCEIVAFSDKEIHFCEGIDYVKIGDINKINYDYVVIAVLDDLNSELIEKSLLVHGIPPQKIVKRLSVDNNKGINNYFKEKKGIEIAICINGGMGDHVVAEAFFEKLTNMFPNATYTLIGKKPVIEVLFYGKNIEKIYNYGEERVDEFDIYISLRLCAYVVYYNEYVINNDEEIRLLVEGLENECAEYEYISSDRTKDTVLLKQAELQGLNRYGYLGGRTMALSEDDVCLEINPNYYEEFKELNLQKYITVNYGADLFGHDFQQTKVWPKKYFEILVKEIKTLYPELTIVQIGGANVEYLEGVDRCILGKSLYLVEHILHNSLLHIDSEGGLVHLASALKTKCIVMFGPTPVHFYGYKNNINVVGNCCKNCMGVIDDWMFRCIKNQENPECMYTITPEQVLMHVEEALN